MLTMMVVVVMMICTATLVTMLNGTDVIQLATLYFICATGLNETVDGL
jgi:hypothetical protein